MLSVIHARTVLAIKCRIFCMHWMAKQKRPFFLTGQKRKRLDFRLRESKEQLGLDTAVVEDQLMSSKGASPLTVSSLRWANYLGRALSISKLEGWICGDTPHSNAKLHSSSVLKISSISLPSDLQSTVLRERAKIGHCDKSREFVAFVDGEEAGLLSYEDWSNNCPGFIYEIFVLSSFRQKGVGNLLLAHAEDYARQLGCKSIRLKPYSLDQGSNQSQLIAWYTNAGYRQAPDVPEHMEKLLHPHSAA